jgi:DNA-binding transcriptional LysR family regulator
MNNPDGIYRAVLDAVGVANVPIWLFEHELLDGRVQAVLRDFRLQPAPIQLVYSAQRLLPLRARVFMDFIAEEFSRHPTLNEGGLEHVLRKVGN